MNTRSYARTLIFSIALLAGLAACGPAATPPAQQDTPAVVETQVAPDVSLPVATTETIIPVGSDAEAGSQKCDYTIDYPSEMQATDQAPYSRLFSFPPSSPDAGPANFIYVSVITPEIQKMVQDGTYGSDVYNYDPSASQTLLGMQVGESKAAHPAESVSEWFTYQRMPDTTIGGLAAQAYENLKPWEFPAGTKEIRFYVSAGGCTYLVGGYVDTTGSDKPGAITEELFNQIIATIQLVP
jgi:hypothetical protein